MSVLISGVLTDGTGLPMSGCHIILKARQNTPAVVMRNGGNSGDGAGRRICI